MKPHQLILLSFLLIAAAASAAVAQERWQAPFDMASTNVVREDSLLTFQDIVELVASRNPILKTLPLELEAARHRIRQAGRWSNPELETELEEVAWEAPGLKESELSISLSQEFELFGEKPYNPSDLRMVKKFAKSVSHTRIDKILLDAAKV